MKHKFSSAKGSSLFSKTVILLVFVALLQGLIFYAFTMNSSTIKGLRDDAFTSLQSRVDNRAQALQSVLTANTANEEIYRKLNIDTNAVFSGDHENQTVLMNAAIADDLKKVLRSTSATGAFVIFDKDVFQRNYYASLYLRDLEPSIISPDDSDIMDLYGSGELVKELGYTLDSLWQSSVNLSQDQKTSDFYFKVMQAAKEYPTYQQHDLGYWSEPFHIQEDDLEIITYSFPLMDENHEVYGVAGIEFGCDYLVNYLDYDELHNGNQNSYSLAIQRTPLQYQSAILSGPTFSELKDKNIIVEALENDSIVKIDNSTIPAYASVKNVMLYDQNTPFADEQWSLLGIVGENALLSGTHSLSNTFLLSFVLALGVGILAAIFISYHFTKPIRKLSYSLKARHANGNIQLPRVRIREIDNLSSSIENLSKDVAYASSRLSQILHVMDMPLGAIEYNKQDENVYCTEQISDLLDFYKREKEALELSRDEFLQLIEKFKRKIITKLPDTNIDQDNLVTLQYLASTGSKRWIRFHVIEHTNEWLVVVNDVSAEIYEKQKLEYERDYDVLTNLLNRRAFRQQVSNILNDKSAKNGVMIMWDLDNLKYINDTYGHDFGDKYICRAAEVFATLSNANAVIARMAGDEFLAYIYNFTSEFEIKELLRTTHQTLLETSLSLPDHTNLRIRASAGVSWYGKDAYSYDDLIKHSDFAMYQVKNSNKGNIKEFNPSSYERDEVLLSGKEELNLIFEKNLVHFLYQPIVDAITGDIYGYEALMRPESNHITSPTDMIRLAKSQSKLNQLEYMTWSNVLKQCEQNRNAIKDCKIFINSIPNVHVSKKDMDIIAKKYNVDFHKIVIEIIESDDVDKESMDIKKHYAREHGASIAIDDYGSGYNNEGALLRIKPDYLKIDMDLIQGISSDKDRELLVKNMVKFAHSKDIKVIAEGIENMPDLQICIKLGVDYIQGFYLGKPNIDFIKIKSEHVHLIRSLAKVYK